jgi:beta-phosphoglucomutase family hydrolase
MSALPFPITPTLYDAVLFDLDGVLTSTARIHADCWQQMFDTYLRQRARDSGEAFQPFDPQSDYHAHLDGKPRLDGVRDFLQSRSISLPMGDPTDPPDRDTQWGLANRKSALVQEAFATQGVEAYPGSVTWVHQLHAAGIKTAVVTSSTSCDTVLAAAGIADLFEVRVDGALAAQRQLPGKPAPDTFLAAAELLAAEPPRTVVVEDAIAGVQAGRAGGFGLVIGVSRKDDAAALKAHGADLVVYDLVELVV